MSAEDAYDASPGTRLNAEHVRADFNQPLSVAHYSDAAETVGLWASERTLIDRLFPDREAELLEAGCGTGRVTLGLHAMGYRRITAFDFAENLLVEARRLAAERGASAIRFLLADATRLGDFPEVGDSHAGVLFPFNGLMQIPGRENRRAALRSLAAHCRAGAPLLFTTHDRNATLVDRRLWREEAERWARGEQDQRVHEFGDRYFEDPHAGRIFMHLPDREEILEDLAATGWEHREDHLRCEIAIETYRVERFSDECRFWIAARTQAPATPVESPQAS